MTFAELQASVAEDCNYGATPAAAVTTRIKKYLNDSVRVVLSEPGMSRLQDSDLPYVFQSVALQSRYTLPDAIAAIRGMSDRTNDRTLRMIDMPTYRQRNPDPPSNSGVPTAYVPFGITAVATQPIDALAHSIVAKSTSAADTTQTIAAEGVLSGVTVTSTALLTGTTGVTLASSTMESVTDIFLTAVAVGTVTVHLDTALGTTIATIPIGKLRARYLGFRLDPTPAAAVDYYVDYRRQTVDMTSATDEPPLPLDFHPLCAAYARMREYEKTQDDRLTIAVAEYQRWLSRLKYAVLENADHFPVAGRQRPYGFSRLGGMFPNDSWRY